MVGDHANTCHMHLFIITEILINFAICFDKNNISNFLSHVNDWLFWLESKLILLIWFMFTVNKYHKRTYLLLPGLNFCYSLIAIWTESLFNYLAHFCIHKKVYRARMQKSWVNVCINSHKVKESSFSYYYRTNDNFEGIWLHSLRSATEVWLITHFWKRLVICNLKAILVTFLRQNFAIHFNTTKSLIHFLRKYR
jgi:hypothetical protein